MRKNRIFTNNANVDIYGKLWIQSEDGKSMMRCGEPVRLTFLDLHNDIKDMSGRIKQNMIMGWVFR